MQSLNTQAVIVLSDKLQLSWHAIGRKGFPRNLAVSLGMPSSSLGSSTHAGVPKREREREREAAESASTSWQASPSTSGAGSLQRQHSKEHSRVIKRGKWSPGGEVRLFQAVSSKGNLAMTSAEPWLRSTRRPRRRERTTEKGQRREGDAGTILYSHNRGSLSLSLSLSHTHTHTHTQRETRTQTRTGYNTQLSSRGESAPIHLWPPADLRAVAGLSAGNLLL